MVLAAVVIVGGEAGKRGNLFAADLAEFGHADNDRQRGTLTDAGHAEDEVEAPAYDGLLDLQYAEVLR